MRTFKARRSSQVGRVFLLYTFWGAGAVGEILIAGCSPSLISRLTKCSGALRPNLQLSGQTHMGVHRPESYPERLPTMAGLWPAHAAAEMAVV